MTILVALAGCPPPGQDDGGDTAAGMVTEADSIWCGNSEDIFDNHTDFNRNLHIRLENACYTNPNDSLGAAGPATLRVLDEQGNVVNNQEITVLPTRTSRGSFSVPGKGRVEVRCGRAPADRGHCHWSYSYSP